MSLKLFPILAGVALAAVIAAQHAPDARAADGVTLARGGAQIKTETLAGGIEVVRGPALEARPYTGPKSSPIRLATGERVWFIDEDRGRLTACTVRFTGTVGRETIRCAARRLPHGVRTEGLAPAH